MYARFTELCYVLTGLPLCIDTEDITVSLDVRTRTSASTTDSNQLDDIISGVQSTTPTPAVIVFLVTLQLCFSNAIMLNLSNIH